MTSVLRLFATASALVASLFVLSTVHAQDGVGGCPPGQIPYSGTDISSCGPMPDSHDQQLARPQPPPPRWTNQWGAIATFEPKGVLGASTNMSNKAAAEHAAVEDCQSRSGGSNCKLEITYDDQCVALVVGDKVYNTSSAATIDQATQSGLQRCSAASSNCHVYYSACSLPKRIQ